MRLSSIDTIAFFIGFLPFLKSLLNTSYTQRNYIIRNYNKSYNKRTLRGFNLKLRLDILKLKKKANRDI